MYFCFFLKMEKLKNKKRQKQNTTLKTFFIFFFNDKDSKTGKKLKIAQKIGSKEYRYQFSSFPRAAMNKRRETLKHCKTKVAKRGGGKKQQKEPSRSEKKLLSSLLRRLLRRLLA